MTISLGVGYLALELYLFRELQQSLGRIFILPIALGVGTLFALKLIPDTRDLLTIGVRLLLASSYLALSAWEWYRGKDRWKNSKRMC
jgi:hypothetical protein